MRKPVHSMLFTNNQTSFHLWLEENLIKYQKIQNNMTMTAAVFANRKVVIVK